MFDDDLEPLAKKQALRNLAPMSLDELAEYIEELKTEIIRIENEISRKKASAAAADSVFKS